MKNILVVVTIVGFMVMGMANIAGSTVFTFNDRATWLSALEDVQTVNFNSQTSDWWIESSWQSVDGPYDAGPMTISEIGWQTVDCFIDVSPFIGGYGNIDGTAYLRTQVQKGSSRVTQFKYDSPIYAWGADSRTSEWDSGFSAVYNFNGVGSVSDPVQTDPTFFGIISTDPFSTIDVTGNYAVFALGFDNISHTETAPVPAAPVPEPATIFLLGFGLVGLAGFRRKKFKM